MKRSKSNSKFVWIFAILLIIVFGSLNSNNSETDTTVNNSVSSNITATENNVSEEQTEKEGTSTESSEITDTADKGKAKDDSSIKSPKKKTQKKNKKNKASKGKKKDENTFTYDGVSYTIIQVDGGDRSGYRESNVAVDIGFGDRCYWGLTNEYGQLVHVLADEIILQDDSSEPVTSSGRYYADEANVPGTEQSDLDQGHVIADSLGGVSNAYNITPQNSTLNRHGDQAYMEKIIRDAGGCTNFVATITYPNTSTQIPSSYKYQYTINGNEITDEFPNEDPEGNSNDTTVASKKGSSGTKQVSSNKASDSSGIDEQKELSKIDTNDNGKVTIKEAKDAGYKMPIYSDHWLYKYMDDRDHDGVVGE